MSKLDLILAERQRIINQCPECGVVKDILIKCKRKCYAKFKRYSSYSFASIPRELWDLELDDFDVTVHPSENVKRDDASAWTAERKKALDNVKLYIKHIENARKKGLGLILFGSFGSGKSMLAACILKKALESGKTVKMREFYDITNAIRKGYRYSDEVEKWEEEFEDTEFYCIENFTLSFSLPQGSGDERIIRPPDYVTREIARLLSLRRQLLLPCIMTTRHNFDELAKLQNDDGLQLLDTFHGNDNTIWVAGPSYRQEVLTKSYRKRLESNDGT